MDPAEIVKNLRIAFNRTTSRGTILDALLKILEQGVEYEEIRAAILDQPAPPKRVGLARAEVGGPPANGGAFKDPIITIGNKHKGQKMSEVARENPGWLTWAIDNGVSSDWFREQCRLALELHDRIGGPLPKPPPLSTARDEWDEHEDEHDQPF